MGCYDTFKDGKNEIQLKNFGESMSYYKKGDKVPMKEYGYPKDGLFFCFACPMSGFVLIKNSIFVGIVRCDVTKKYPKIRIWDCGGAEGIYDEQKK